MTSISNNDDYSHIYMFLKKKQNLPITDKIFYVGSSKNIHERISQHVTAIYESYKQTKPIEVYAYINNSVGVENFDVYVIDHVPLNFEKAYERVYYDLLVAQGCYLQNCNKPIPENTNNNVIRDISVTAPCAIKLMNFQKRNSMTVEENLINELKKHVIKYQNVTYKNQLKLDNDRLKRLNKELKLQRENDKGEYEMVIKTLHDEIADLKIQSVQEMNTLLTKQVVLHETNISLNNEVAKNNNHQKEDCNLFNDKIVKVERSSAKHQPKTCFGCNKQISYSYWSAHLKNCKKYKELPSYQEIKERNEYLEKLLNN